MLDYVVSSAIAEWLAYALELSAAIAAGLGDGLRAARLAGAAAGIREKAGMPITGSDAALLERYLAPTRAAAAAGAWQAELAAGRVAQPAAGDHAAARRSQPFKRDVPARGGTRAGVSADGSRPW